MEAIWKQVILGVALIVAASMAVNSFKNHQIQTISESNQIQRDSLTTQIENGRQDRQTILDSLQALDATYREYVEETGDRIANYTRLVGTLRIQADRLSDSLQQKNRIISALSILNMDTTSSQVFNDTTLIATRTWSDSLFATTAVVSFLRDSLSLDSRLRQLRPLRLDIVTTQSEDLSRVNTYVRSPDFDSLEATSYTELKHPDQPLISWKDLPKTIGAFLLGLLIGK